MKQVHSVGTALPPDVARIKLPTESGSLVAAIKASASAQTVNRQRRAELVKNLFNRFVKQEEGQDLIEYGLLIGIITIACIVSIQAIGPKVGSYFSNLNATLP